MTDGEFIPEFDVDAILAEPIATIELVDDPQPVHTCSYPLPVGFFSDIVVSNLKTFYRIIPPTTAPLPVERRDEALTGTALLRASGTECYPSGYCRDWTGWALAQNGKLIACDAWWIDRLSPSLAALFGSTGERVDIAVWTEPAVRKPLPGTCTGCEAHCTLRWL